MLQMMAVCFQRQALALYDRAGFTVLSDSAHQHCWTIPLGTVSRSGQGDDGGDLVSDSRHIPGTHCCCGGVALASLPCSTTWHLLCPIPLTTSSHSPSNHDPLLQASSAHHGLISDLLTSRLAALHCASELAQTVITTAFTVTSHQ